jgi:hypothetical protein
MLPSNSFNAARARFSARIPAMTQMFTWVDVDSRLECFVRLPDLPHITYQFGTGFQSRFPGLPT